MGARAGWISVSWLYDLWCEGRSGLWAALAPFSDPLKPFLLQHCVLTHLPQRKSLKMMSK